jgi:8-oxo-(d)GTP phosphatase
MANVETAAGCIVLREGNDGPEVLLIYTLKFPDPTMPKGRVKDGETLKECAIREVEEETGYRVEIVCDSSIASQRILDSYPPVVQKTTYWFLAEAVSGSPEMRMEKSLITRVEWVSVTDALIQIQRTDENQALAECVKRL